MVCRAHGIHPQISHVPPTLPEQCPTNHVLISESALSMKSTWGELERAYGSGYASSEPGDPENDFLPYLAARFDRYPGLLFFMENLDWTALRAADADIEIHFSSVPDSATIQRVHVRPAGCSVGLLNCPRDTGR